MSKHGPAQVTSGTSPVIKTVVYPEGYCESQGNEKALSEINEYSKPLIVAGNNPSGDDERPTLSFVVMVTMALAELGGTATSQVCDFSKFLGNFSPQILCNCGNCLFS